MPLRINTYNHHRLPNRSGGVVTGREIYDYGETKTSPRPLAAYHFATGPRAVVSPLALNYSFTATADRTLVAHFSDKWTITASVGAGGTIDPVGDVLVVPGADQAFTITSDTGYKVADVKVDGASQGPLTAYTFTNVTAGHTISATFALNTYTISASADPAAGGTVSGAGDYGHGQTVNLSASANAGYTFTNWTEGAVVVSLPNYSFTLRRTGLGGNFELNTYTISASVVGGNGQVRPATQQVLGGTATIDLIPMRAITWKHHRTGG